MCVKPMCCPPLPTFDEACFGEGPFTDTLDTFPAVNETNSTGGSDSLGRWLVARVASSANRVWKSVTGGYISVQDATGTVIGSSISTITATISFDFPGHTDFADSTLVMTVSSASVTGRADTGFPLVNQSASCAGVKLVAGSDSTIRWGGNVANTTGVVPSYPEDVEVQYTKNGSSYDAEVYIQSTLMRSFTVSGSECTATENFAAFTSHDSGPEERIDVSDVTYQIQGGETSVTLPTFVSESAYWSELSGTITWDIENQGNNSEGYINRGVISQPTLTTGKIHRLEFTCTGGRPIVIVNDTRLSVYGGTGGTYGIYFVADATTAVHDIRFVATANTNGTISGITLYRVLD